jgi:hypothetical protein
VGLLSNIAGNVEAAFAQAQAQANPYGAALSNVTDAAAFSQGQIQTVNYDYSSPGDGSRLWSPNIRGDWLYVDKASCGGPAANLWGGTGWNTQIILSPGKVVNVPFDKVSIYVGSPCTLNSPISINPPPGQEGYTQAPRLILWYGTGNCPFQDTSGNGCESPYLLLIQQSNASIWSLTAALSHVRFTVPPGALIEMHTWWEKIVTVQNTSSILLAELNSLVPTFSEVIAFLNGSNSAHTQAIWKDVRMDRISQIIDLQCVEIAQDNTDPIGFQASACYCLIR